ncbi:hypothetical protein Bca4012_060517 [Brassica carinata]|uniref:Uncharacterized protein n=1 Tax=Brassica carinata TaxID=52824 RepID=A0A8X7SB89_BRACI|nr:hypothetical protein Bca52824_030851 [Brassica carinata]
MHMWGFSKQKVPMSACSGCLHKAENQPFTLFTPPPPPCVVPCNAQRKTTPKTNNRKS